MRLLPTTKLKFHEFLDDPSTLNYAVLSHRWEHGWGQEEIPYHKFHSRRNLWDRSPGMKKILKCRELANEQGFKWVWIDCCCIDKTNNTEISEAINSMWGWYYHSGLCIVYLADVPMIQRDKDIPHFTGFGSYIMSQENYSALQQSSWFTRGWTFQRPARSS